MDGKHGVSTPVKRKHQRGPDSSQSVSSASDDSIIKSKEKKKKKIETITSSPVSSSEKVLPKFDSVSGGEMADGEREGNSDMTEATVAEEVFPIGVGCDREVSNSDIMNKLCKLCDTVNELRASIYNVQLDNDKLKREVSEAKEREEDLRQQLAEARHLAEIADRRSEEVSAYVRRNNMRIYGVKEGKTETQEECEAKVLSLLNTKLKLKVTSEQIEAVHRVGPHRPAGSTDSAKDTNKPRGIVVRFVSRRVRDTVLYARKGLKGTKTVFVEDLTPRAYTLLCTVKSDTSVCAQAWTRNGSVIMKTQNGKIVNVRSSAEFKHSADRATWAKK